VVYCCFFFVCGGVGVVQQQPSRNNASQYSGRPAQFGQVPSDRNHIEFSRILARVQLSVVVRNESAGKMQHMVERASQRANEHSGKSGKKYGIL